MKPMIKGETVTVTCLNAVVDGDNFHRGVKQYANPVTVGDVLVEPVTGSDSVREDVHKWRLKLHFPKTFTALLAGSKCSLRGGFVQVRGNSYKVLGAPEPYTPANTPTRWSMPVVVEHVESYEMEGDYWQQS